MKAILTLVFVILFGALAIAQNNDTPKKVQVDSPESVVLVINKEEVLSDEEQTYITVEIALVFRYRNTRIKDSLAFTTNTGRSRLV